MSILHAIVDDADANAMTIIFVPDRLNVNAIVVVKCPLLAKICVADSHVGLRAIAAHRGSCVSLGGFLRGLLQAR